MMLTKLNVTTRSCDIDYKITKVIAPGKIIYVDDGVLSFEVISVDDEQTLKVRSLNAGKISSHKGVNLPGTDVDLPALSKKISLISNLVSKQGPHDLCFLHQNC